MARLRLKYRRQHSIRVDSLVSTIAVAAQRVHCGHGDWLLSFATDYGSHRHAGIWRTIARPAVASPAAHVSVLESYSFENSLFNSYCREVT